MNGYIERKWVFILVFVCICFSCGDLFAAKKKYEKISGGLDALIEISQDQKKMEKVLRAETKSYKKVKRAVASDSIKIGDQASLISDKYGDPVVMLKEEDLTEKWIYKDGNSDFFSQEQIWLVFGEDGNLTAVQYPPESLEPSDIEQ